MITRLGYTIDASVEDVNIYFRINKQRMPVYAIWERVSVKETRYGAGVGLYDGHNGLHKLTASIDDADVLNV
jgi:hypothetical protein